MPVQRGTRARKTVALTSFAATVIEHPSEPTEILRPEKRQTKVERNQQQERATIAMTPNSVASAGLSHLL